MKIYFTTDTPERVWRIDICCSDMASNCLSKRLEGTDLHLLPLAVESQIRYCPYCGEEILYFEGVEIEETV